ncbi:MAG: CAP domain-containing protein [Deltaproteobacteria bacterium]|jgi:uncharacterized protein YkwD|nr:CAP domain-containing protein [Deltaproteobacteria bacterium]
MRRKAVLFLLAVCLILTLGYGDGYAQYLHGLRMPGSHTEAVCAEKLAGEINRLRSDSGLRPLEPDPGLVEVADYAAGYLTVFGSGSKKVNLSREISLDYPLKQAGVAGRVIGEVRVYSNLDYREMAGAILDSKTLTDEIFYRDYTHLGLRVRELPGEEKVAVIILGTGLIDTDKFRLDVFNMVNDVRIKAGVQKVEWSEEAALAAQKRAREILLSPTHTRPGGENWSTVLKQSNIRATVYGENIAGGQRDPQRVMASWLNSPGHRDNILHSRFNRLGVGLLVGSDGRLHWTQIFLAQKKSGSGRINEISKIPKRH